MKPFRNSVLLCAAILATGALAQGTPPAQPPPPPSVAPPMPPVPPRMMSPSMPPGRFMSPMGMQARFTYEVIRTNRDDLKVTDAQMKTIDADREAADKTTYDRAMSRNNLRNDIQVIADGDSPDMAKLEAKVQQMMKMQGDDMMADFKLTAAYRKALTPEQREKIKTMAPKFEPLIPMSSRPAMMGAPTMSGAPGAPGMPGMAPAGQNGAVPVVPKPATP